MRGEAFHNSIVDQAGRIFTSHRWEVYMEYRYPCSAVTTYLDIFAVRGCWKIGCEVETTPRHILDNAVKAAIAGIPLLVIVPSRKLQRLGRRTIESSDIAGVSMTKVLLLSQLEHELANFERERIS